LGLEGIGEVEEVEEMCRRWRGGGGVLGEVEGVEEACWRRRRRKQ